MPAQVFGILFGTGSLYAKDSGPYLSVLQTAQQLRHNGHRVTVVGTRSSGEGQLAEEWSGLEVRVFRRLGPQSLHFAPNVKPWLAECGSFDVASLQSVWLHSNAQIAAWCRGKGVPYMITAHGNFNPAALQISRWKKSLAQGSFARELLRGAACFQATSESEIGAMRAFGIRQAICLIPNGITLPTPAQKGELEELIPQKLKQKRTCLYVGRVHPIKGLDLLLEAWSQLKQFAEEWQLIIAGRGEDAYCRELQKIIDYAMMGENVRLIGYVSDDKKAAWLQQAELYVLPSRSEGFAMMPLEAMAAGVPVLMTRECNFPRAAESGAALLVECNATAMSQGLRALLAMSNRDLSGMGGAGRAFVAEHYNWEQICSQLEGVYAWMAGAGAPPANLHFE